MSILFRVELNLSSTLNNILILVHSHGKASQYFFAPLTTNEYAPGPGQQRGTARLNGTGAREDPLSSEVTNHVRQFETIAKNMVMY